MKAEQSATRAGSKTLNTKAVVKFNANKVRATDLPQFAQGKWRKTFLPTLYDKFFASNEPFDTFAKGSNEFVALLQATIQEVFPEVAYQVTSTDSIHFLVSIFPRHFLFS